MLTLIEFKHIPFIALRLYYAHTELVCVFLCVASVVILLVDA